MHRTIEKAALKNPEASKHAAIARVLLGQVCVCINVVFMNMFKNLCVLAVLLGLSFLCLNVTTFFYLFADR